MTRIKKPSEVLRRVGFVSRFAPDNPNPEALYGLPQEVMYCSRCVISNQRPNSAVEYTHTHATEKSTIFLDQEQICDACKAAEQKKANIDWRVREKALWDLCNQHRKNGERHDCLVPGSGGKDSFYAAHLLKYKYGMNPLTVTWAPHRYTDWGWRNFQAWLDAGFDNYLITPNPRVHRLLTRLAVENLFHPFQPFILGQKQVAPKIAQQLNIPLIFYGESEAEYGNPRADLESAKQHSSFFSHGLDSEIHLGGVSLTELNEEFGLKSVDLGTYVPLDPNIIMEKLIEVHYLGYYVPWHPQGAYYYSVEHGGFQPSPERTPGTYSKYNSIDDKIDDFHFYTMFTKFGIGRASYDASQEIRNGEISREEGIALVRKFDGEFPTRFSEEIFSYLSIPADEFPVASENFEQPIMDREYFDHLTDTFRSPHLWQRIGAEWELRRKVWEDAGSA